MSDLSQKIAAAIEPHVQSAIDAVVAKEREACCEIILEYAVEREADICAAIRSRGPATVTDGGLCDHCNPSESQDAVAVIRAERDSFASTIEDGNKVIDQLVAERDRLKAEVERLTKQGYSQLCRERDEAVREVEILQRKFDSMCRQYDMCDTENDRLRAECARMNIALYEAASAIAEFSGKEKELVAERDRLRAECRQQEDDWLEKYTKLALERHHAENRYEKLTKDCHDGLDRAVDYIGGASIEGDVPASVPSRIELLVACVQQSASDRQAAIEGVVRTVADYLFSVYAQGWDTIGIRKAVAAILAAKQAEGSKAVADDILAAKTEQEQNPAAVSEEQAAPMPLCQSLAAIGRVYPHFADTIGRAITAIEKAEQVKVAWREITKVGLTMSPESIAATNTLELWAKGEKK